MCRLFYAKRERYAPFGQEPAKPPLRSLDVQLLLFVFAFDSPNVVRQSPSCRSCGNARSSVLRLSAFPAMPSCRTPLPFLHSASVHIFAPTNPCALAASSSRSAWKAYFMPEVATKTLVLAIIIATSDNRTHRMPLLHLRRQHNKSLVHGCGCREEAPFALATAGASRAAGGPLFRRRHLCRTRSTHNLAEVPRCFGPGLLLTHGPGPHTMASRPLGGIIAGPSPAHRIKSRPKTSWTRSIASGQTTVFRMGLVAPGGDRRSAGSYKADACVAPSPSLRRQPKAHVDN